MERILTDTPGTISNQWYSADDPADPGTVTVGITRADGTVLVAPGAGTGGSGVNPRTFTLTTAHTATLDLLTVTWTTSLLGESVTHVEVVGGFLFTLAQARLDPDLSDQTAVPDALLREKRTIAEVELEHALGVALVPRYTRERISGNGRNLLQTTWAMPRVLRACSVGQITEVALTASAIAQIKPFRFGWMRQDGWEDGVSNVVIGYEHGYDWPLGDVLNAALALTKRALSSPASSSSGIVIRAEAGQSSITYASPSAGASTRVFGIPDVDNYVANWDHRQKLFA
jgi:hypothetical protein